MTFEELVQESFKTDIFVYCPALKIAENFARVFWNWFYRVNGAGKDVGIADAAATITARLWWRDDKHTCYRIKNGNIQSIVPKSFISKYTLSYPHKVVDWEDYMNTQEEVTLCQ